MAYTRLGLKDGEKVYASHVSHVEDGIDDCESQITELKDSLTQLAGGQYYTSLSSLLEFVNTLSLYQIALVYVSNDLMQELGGSSAVSKGFIAKTQRAENSFDYFLEAVYGSNIYCGRIADGVPTYCFRYVGTSISLSSVTSENSIK